MNNIFFQKSTVVVIVNKKIKIQSFQLLVFEVPSFICLFDYYLKINPFDEVSCRQKSVKNV